MIKDVILSFAVSAVFFASSRASEQNPANPYWYSMEGATGNGEVTPEDVRVKIGDPTGWGASDKVNCE